MWKKATALALVLMFVLGLTAQAAPMRAPATTSRISFSGTTATCTVIVRGEKADDAISVTAKLWQGSTCLKTWTASGTQVVTLSKPATVEKGKTYKLTADVTINGVKQATKSTTATCP